MPQSQPQRDPLTPEETDLAVNFYVAACNFPAYSFLEVARRVLGAKGFTLDHSHAFIAECQRHYDLAHAE